MVADLLQLVFVGSEVYSPGTDALDKRDVDGMVLNLTPGRGVEIGYIVVNLILSTGKFLAIGAYLDSSTRNTKSFVIQTAYDEEKLSPLEAPITVDHLTVDGRIPTLELLTTSLDAQGMILHHYPGAQRKKFHAYLFRHQLIPLDLSVSHRVLAEYADILQSFSRGKTLDAGDSNSLKKFLFGNEKAKEITQKFRKAVEEMQAMMREYTQTQKDIEQVTEKSYALRKLKKDKDNSERLHRVWVEKLCAYCLQEQQRSLNTLTELGEQYLSARTQLLLIYDLVSEQLVQKEVMEVELNEVEEKAKQDYDHWSIQSNNLNPFIDLMKRYNCRPEELISIYQDNAEKHQKQRLYRREMAHFESKGVFELLDRFKQEIDKTKAVEALEKEITGLENILGEKKTLLQFANINHEGTLGSWAITNFQAFSREVESILMFFQNKPVGETPPTAGVKQYVPDPSALLTIPAITGAEPDGFWLTLGAVKQYIPYVKTQLFKQEYAGHLHQLLEKLRTDIETEVNTLTQEISQLKQLKTAVIESTGFTEFIGLLPQAQQIAGFQVDELLLMPQAEFDQGLELLKNRDHITSEQQRAYEAWKAAQTKANRFTGLIKSLNLLLTKLAGIGQSDDELLESLKEIGLKTAVLSEDDEGAVRYLRSRYRETDDAGDWLEGEVRRHLDQLKTDKIREASEVYTQQTVEKEAAWKMARLVMAFEPEINLDEQPQLKKPIEEEKEFDVAKLLYSEKFKETVLKYAPGEAYKFEAVQNYLELCSDMLPEAFINDAAIDDDQSMDTIGYYLSKINEKNKNLNFTKFQRLREIIEEVIEELDKRLNTVRLLNNFLNHEDREITGGHRVSLKHDFDTDFPKAWLESFGEKLNNENTLFQAGETLAELLKDSVSLEEKMLNAFYTFGGAKSVKPKIEDLLDPNSYFGLTFRMETVSGHKNSGSTGQTYAAIALLCLARLSLINKSAFSKNGEPGVRFMPIDEAEGLGSNFDMLYTIAKEFGFQIITMSISPLGRYLPGEQYIYVLSNNKEESEQLNFQPAGIFSETAYHQFIANEFSAD